jgi:primosomal protein N'
MRIIEVSPIAKGISRETLSYFTAEEIQPGAIVEVPVRSRNLPALVISSRSAHDHKAEIKSADFTLKKVGKLKFSHFFLPSFIESVQKTSPLFVSQTGQVLNALIPKSLLEYAQERKLKKEMKEDTSTSHLPEKYVLQRSEEERYDAYKCLIREEFARKASIFICLPTIEEAEKTYQLLKKGIENYVFLFHSSIKPKELEHSFDRLLKEAHPVLIIATGIFLSLPREDVNTYIIEKEASRFYKQMARPFIDIRTFAEQFNSCRKKKLIMADSLLRTETIQRVRQGDFAEYEPMSFKVFDSAPPIIVDMKGYKETPKPFRVLSEEVVELAQNAVEKGDRLFFYSARRGLSPAVICGDCGQAVVCDHCGTGVTLHQSKKDAANYFLCHHCGEKRPAEERCRACSSWKLITLGIGSELVEKELTLHVPKATVLRFDRDSVKTEKQEKALIKKFYDTPGSILVGTESALSYLAKPIEGTAIISLDSLFSVPDFRMQEKIMQIILKIRWLGQHICLIQTRNPDNKILQYAVKGNLLDFYKDEIRLRETFAYPPFKTLIKISFDGKKSYLIEELTKLHDLLKEYDFNVFPAFIKNGKGSYTTHLLLKIDTAGWPDKILLSKLYTLPPSFVIKVDPDTMG